MEVLCNYHKNLFIVGDPDQTVYTWRGANVKFLLDFDRQYPSCKTIMMMKNYRSTPQILATANALIDKNRTRIKKELIATLPAGESVLCHHAKNAEAEAEWIALQIFELAERGVPFSDMTVLYRAHYVTRQLEEVFLRRNLPYTLYSGVQFFNRQEIKDALSYLRMIAYKDDLSFRRIVNLPKRNVGRRRIAFLEEYAAAHHCSLYTALCETLSDDLFKGTQAARFVRLIESFAENYSNRQISDLLSDLLDRSGYETMLRTEGSQDRLDNLAELKQSVYDYEITCGEEATLEHYLSHIALFTNSDAEENGEKIKMMTVHAAKGLEFPYVFLCEMNEGIFPSRKVSTLPSMEEERRLAFVAMTRAEKRLFLSEAEGRNLDGSPRYPSRFLLDIGEDLLEYTAPPRRELIRDAREYIAASERRLPESEEAAFAPGDRIRHPIMGEGEILELDPDKGAYLIRFDRLETTRSISMKAKLERAEAQP